ncbi:MAG: Rieske (2Fe-2S) protein [Chloroflexi bacterium]|nr:Rieske (2Fe-2S) protein [Chloroflexota bacterium]
MAQNVNMFGKRSSPEPVTRRGFLQWALGTAFVATISGVVIPIIGYLWPPARRGAGGASRLLVGPAKDLPVGQAKVLPVNDKPVIVVNTAQGGIKAFSAICTHLGCVVEWHQSKQYILCPCHDGRFNAVTGAVISGPPPSALPAVRVSVENGDIYVGGA